MASSTGKPYKVWNKDRSLKKALTAHSLEEVISKGKTKLGLRSEAPVKLVLNEDGTEIDEEDYFTFLPNNTTFLLMSPDDKWRPEGCEEVSTDEPDYLSPDSAQRDRLRHQVEGLRRDITRIITFSNDDLQSVIDMTVDELCSLLQDTRDFAQSLQSACQRHLDERQQTAEAIDLLRLYHKARQFSPYVGGESDTKKRKVTPST
ncbi:DNA fragmentation factor subunit alpha-like [Liolophura sinensis]|uniref:DNA fragmentation factor subunit alpha-like n=1 Tax=Liolophura sinensis TaxID=3198878 RepID=UPI0031596FED